MASFQTLSAVRRQGAAQETGVVLAFPDVLERHRAEIARALPKHLHPDRMMRVALTAFRESPKLAECDPMSVLAAVVQASQLGLEIGLLGEAHLVPYKTRCQLIPGYMGLMKLARQSGFVADIYAHEVRENDFFKLRLGASRELTHEPLEGKGGFPASIASRGEIVGFYAVCTFKDGTNTFVTGSTEDVNLIRDSSGAYKSAKQWGKETPWDTHYVPMGKKTLIRELSKYLPKSPELAKALALDAAAEAGIDQKINLKQAVDGSYEPQSPLGGQIDPETGEMGVEPTNHDQAHRFAQAPAPKAAAPAPHAAPKPNVRSQAQPVQRPSRSTATDVQPKTSTANSPKQENKQAVLTLEHYLADMRKSNTIDNLNDSFIRAEDVLKGADLEAVNQEYIKVKSRLDGNGALFQR